MAMNNSLAEVHPELVSEWSEKNLMLTPDDITFGSNKNLNAKFICQDIRTITFDKEFDVVLNMADGAIGYHEWKLCPNTFPLQVMGCRRKGTYIICF